MEKIRQLTAEDIEAYIDHLSRHLPEPGIDGIISQPYSSNEPIDKDKFRKKILERWLVNPGQGAWEVAWGIFEGNRIVGHLELMASSMSALQHRAKLGMGIETKYRSKDHGRLLMERAISWAKAQEFLNWIDLEVFAHNKVAIKLYKSFGFTSVGKTIDRIRVNQQSIDDYHFVLNLKGRLPQGFSIEHCDSEQFNSIVGKLSETMFEDKMSARHRDFLPPEELEMLKSLNEKYQNNLPMHSVLFYEDKLVGWSFGYQDTRESFHMTNSAILPEYRGKTLYSLLLEEVIEHLRKKGIQRVLSYHSMTNNYIILPKLKKGFLITGLHVNDMVGTLVELTYYMNPIRRKIMDFRVGQTRPDEELKKIFKL